MFGSWVISATKNQRGMEVKFFNTMNGVSISLSNKSHDILFSERYHERSLSMAEQQMIVMGMFHFDNIFGDDDAPPEEAPVMEEPIHA